MRISTLTIYSQSMRSLNQQQSDLMHVGQQIASGKRVVRPSDDPQAASRAVQVSQAQAITSQYTDSRVSARNALSQEESVLNSITDAVTSAKTLILEAANGTLSDADRASVASQLRGIYETVLGQANATDGNGRYLFGGYQDSSEPFVKDVDGKVQYVGDTQVRSQRIDASRLMPVSDDGNSVFQGSEGSSGFMAVADTNNTGTVTFKGPEIIDAGDPNYGTPFQIEFSVAGGNASYEIKDQNGNVLQAAQPYDPDPDPDSDSGQTIEYAGLSVTLNGAPQNGDAVDVQGFLAVADQGNTGTVTLKGPDIVDTGDSNYNTPFRIAFSVDTNGDASYQITDQSGAGLQPSQSYQPGQTIKYAGLSMTLDGTPEDGDVIDVNKPEPRNTNLFETFEKALAALKEDTAGNDVAKASLQNVLGNVMAEFDNSLDNVLMVRASVGSRLNELSTVDKVSGNRQLNYAQTKSDLVDLDYNTAITEYSLRQVGLQAAQKAFVTMKSMNLFDLL